MKLINLKIPVECYDRSVGYYRPTVQMSPGIRAMIKDRRRYYSKDVKKAIEAKREDI